jgi:hypothetical protein
LSFDETNPRELQNPAVGVTPAEAGRVSCWREEMLQQADFLGILGILGIQG